MSFSRVKVPDWGVNEKLTSAQMNQLDEEHANAVDKYGDTIEGLLELNSGARIVAGSGSRFVNASGGIYEAQSGSNTNIESGAALTAKAGSTTSIAGTLTITNAGTTTFQNTPNFANGLSCYGAAANISNGLNMFSTLVMDGDNIAGNIKLRVRDAAFIDMESTSRQRFLSGAFLELQSGSTSSYAGANSWLSGSTCVWASGASVTHNGTYTFANGSTLSHANGSLDQYATGAILTQANGSSWAMSGSQTLLSGGTWIANSGSVITINTTPTFGAGLTVSSGTTTINGAATNLSSSTTTLTGAGNRLKLTPRSVPRKVAPCFAVPNVFTESGGVPSIVRNGSNGSITMDTVGGSYTVAQTVTLAIDPPHNSTLTQAVITVSFSGSGSLSWTLFEDSTPIGGANTVSATGSDTINLSQLVDAENKTYRIVMTKNSGNFSVTWNGCKYTCTVSEYAES